MTTQSYSTVLEHSSDVTFRLWGLALSTALQAAGLTVTSDTGQINWVTVTRPGTATAAGYEIYRFNDTLQGTAPIFIKIEYGTNSTATGPQIWITVGTGSNGSGTITGSPALTTRATCLRNGGPNTVVTPYPVYVCYNATHGFLGCFFKIGAAGGQGMFAVARSCDQSGGTAGDTNATGCMVYRGDSSTGLTSAQPIRFASTSALYSDNTAYSIVPNSQSSSLVGSDNQAYLHWGIHPRVYAVKQMVTVVSAEVPAGNTISVTPVGASARTFISSGASGFPSNIGTGVALTWVCAMLWE